MTAEELERAFSTYVEEINRCLVTKCHWALLHILVILPDICAALESCDGKTDGGRYRNWCKRYFPDDRRFTPGDRYAIRCALLHQRNVSTTLRHRRLAFTVAPGLRPRHRRP